MIESTIFDYILKSNSPVEWIPSGFAQKNNDAYLFLALAWDGV